MIGYEGRNGDLIEAAGETPGYETDSLPVTMACIAARNISPERSSTGRSNSCGWTADFEAIADYADLRDLSPDSTAIAAECPWAIESSIVSGPVAEPAT